MVYIDILKKTEDLSFYIPKSYIKLLGKPIFFLLRFTNKILQIQIEEKTILLLPNSNAKSYEKLNRKLLQNNSKTVCLSKNLEENTDLIDFLNEKNKDILDERWLFSCLTEKVLEYIVNQTESNIREQKIAILTNEFDEKISEWIIKIAQKCKQLELVTKEPIKFKKIEEYLYTEYGIDINVNYNERQSLKNVDIILNFNFIEDEINQFSIARKAIIVNFEKNIDMKRKSFNGININGYQIHMPTNYFNYVIPFQKFSINRLYESFLYKKTSLDNILEQIEKDDVSIHYLVGTRGKIKKQEYLKVLSMKN